MQEHAMPGMRQERDLVLPPNNYAYILDRTKGKVSAYVGPFRSSLSDTDHMVIWQNGKFEQTNDIQRAIQPFVEAGEGQYIVLTNPATGEKVTPLIGSMNDSTDLDMGRKVVIPGPSNFPLWPGQTAQVIDGHHLRHNQYLVVRVYEPQAAKENAGSALMAPQQGGDESDDSTQALKTDLTMGKLIVIKGTDVSFYMPSTGIEVVPDEGQFVREAASLEQLEYAVLLDENGSKRFERGPAVVFPEPTEAFATDDEGNRKFMAIELNKQSGLYIKVIAPYEEDGVAYTEGQELFLTGADTPIYFPRVEHSIIDYGGRRKHHAIAIPEGEGRYVLDRTNGQVALVVGPKMFLPDPRSEVIVRRVLPDKMVRIMYPGNDEALQVNALYAAEQEAIQKQVKARRRTPGGRETAQSFAASTEVLRNAGAMMDYVPEAASTEFLGEKMSRGTEYTPPRTITLDTKYEGAVTVSVWPGYAVLVMDKSGNRRVEAGPKNILLEYDESLMILSLSTGRPKSGDNKLRTPYLRTVNNSVTDQVTVETKDLVPVTLDFTLRVNFEGEDHSKWFDVEDYVALLTDHCRSKLRNLAKRHDIQAFYTNTIDLVRNALLGSASEGGRDGLSFTENGMRLVDVEVLNVQIQHGSVAQLLEGAMDMSLRGAIEVSQAEQASERLEALETLSRHDIEEREKTSDALAKAALASLGRDIAAYATKHQHVLQMTNADQEVNALRRAEEKLDFDQAMEQEKVRNEVALDRLKTEIGLAIDRAKAMDPNLITAINQFGDQEFVERLMESLAPAAASMGVTTADMFAQMFKGTPFEGLMGALTDRPYAAAIGSGSTNGGDH
jgi:major vault protein